MLLTVVAALATVLLPYKETPPWPGEIFFKPNCYVSFMKLLTVGVILSVFFLALLAGCTSQTETNPATPVPTVPPTPDEIQSVITETQDTPSVPDPALGGTWYLKLISEQNGTAQVQTINPEMSVIFDEQFNISGYSGCNNYAGMYTLTGTVSSDGNGITISPLASTKKYCIEIGTTETTYLQILQGATSYLVNVNQELSIRDNFGNTLVYQRTPYSETAVPLSS